MKYIQNNTMIAKSHIYAFTRADSVYNLLVLAQVQYAKDVRRSVRCNHVMQAQATSFQPESKVSALPSHCLDGGCPKCTALHCPKYRRGLPTLHCAAISTGP